MAIPQVPPPRPIVRPGVTPIAPLSLQPARDGDLRVVVWFGPGVALPDDEIVCTEAAVAALFGPDVAQRLLMTPATAWLRRLLPGPLAATLDRAAPDRAADDVVSATPYARIYLLRLTGGLGVAHVCEVLGACVNVALVHPEPDCTEAAPPAKYAANPVFTAEQAYLRKTQGINAEPAWAKGFTGAGVQGGVVDTTADFSRLHFTPRQVAVPPPKTPPGGAAPASATSTHGLHTAGIFGSPDNATIGIGAAPEVSLVFAPVRAVVAPRTGTLQVSLADIAASFAALLATGGLKPGDVVNVSMAVFAGLDVTQPYAGYPALLKQDRTQAWPHRLVTEKAGGTVRPSAVMTTLPLEAAPPLLKFVTDLTAQGITVVEAAGNGLVAFCEPKGKTSPWVEATLGADLAGPWRLGAAKADTVAAFRRALAARAPHSLDRAALATFADGGGIMVAGGQLSAAAAGMIDNIQLNHGNRVDCYVDTPNARPLGFAGNAPGGHIGGSSLCAPVIAGAAAVLQGMATALYTKALRPAIVRALLGDAAFGTATVSGPPVGVMPDLEKLMKLLEATAGTPDGLLKAVAARQAATAARTKAAAPGTFVHDPYTSFTRGQGGGAWQPLPLASASDLFVP